MKRLPPYFNRPSYVPAVFFLAVISLLPGCSSTLVDKIEKPNELPQDLPPEYREKFKVLILEGEEPGFISDAEAPADAGETSTDKKAPPKQEAKEKEVAKKKPSPPSKSSNFKYPDRRPPWNPVWIGEQQIFNISYIGVSAGTFTLTTKGFREVNHRRVYHVHGHAESSRFFSLFYRLNDTVETFIDMEGFFSHRFHLLLDETKQNRNSLEVYDSEKGETFYWDRWQHKEKGYKEKKKFEKIPPFPQDSLSSLYYLRTVPLPTGAVVKFPVISEGKIWEAQVTVVRREEIDTPMGKKKTIVLKPETKFKGVLKTGGENFLWLTDDDRRFLVKLEAKVKIGSVKAVLKEVKLGEKPTMQ